MYSLVPEKTLRLVYEPFYLAIVEFATDEFIMAKILPVEFRR